MLFLFTFYLPFCLAWDVARTPPMGFNTWNLYACTVDAQILKDTAQAIHDSGLQAAGFEYVNSDDCWMLADRDSQGRQMVNPTKFPDGFANVTAFIHNLGMKSGLYTAKGPRTCDGFAASCQHETIDATQWASWGIDYVKDDSCSECRSNDTLDYSIMWAAIQASGRAMVLTVEGNPDNKVCSAGGCGNAKRVGHDISPNWMSMVSLVDIGSGLWVYAHNSTSSQYGGWWNDLDMLEIGNGDFACETSKQALLMCQAHYSLWTIMKAPLLLGNNIPKISNATLNVLLNKYAISVNQDGLGIQAKRVSVSLPSSLKLGSSAWDNVAVINRCDPASSPTQRWTWQNTSQPIKNELFVVPCNPSDPFQQWSLQGPQGQMHLVNAGNGQCVDAGSQSDPLQVSACYSTSASQEWNVVNNSHISNTNTNNCLDVYNFAGPDVDLYGCKSPSDPTDNNQQWMISGKSILTKSSGVPANSCLAVSSGPSQGTLSTIDGNGQTWCLTNFFGSEGGWGGAPCTGAKNQAFVPVPAGSSGYHLGSVSWNNQDGASGPFPHSRYVAGGDSLWIMDPSKTGSIMAADSTSILDDDLLGHVKVGGDFCLDLVVGGILEVWSAPLTSNRVAVVLFNRSPQADQITARWQDMGLNAQAPYSVYDIWADAQKGTVSMSYTDTVPAHAVTYLILTPSS